MDSTVCRCHSRLCLAQHSTGHIQWKWCHQIQCPGSFPKASLHPWAALHPGKDCCWTGMLQYELSALRRLTGKDSKAINKSFKNGFWYFVFEDTFHLCISETGVCVGQSQSCCCCVKWLHCRTLCIVGCLGAEAGTSSMAWSEALEDLKSYPVLPAAAGTPKLHLTKEWGTRRFMYVSVK